MAAPILNLEQFLAELARIHSDAQLVDDLAKARRTLEVMGDLLIRPLSSELRSKGQLELIAPLVRLLVALRELEEGKSKKFLEPKKRAGRTQGTGSTPNARGASSAALTVLMKDGWGKEPAAKKVARWLHASGHRLAGGKPIEGQTVVNWYKRISASAEGTLPSPNARVIDLTGPEPKQDSPEIQVYRFAMRRCYFWLSHALAEGQELHSIKRPPTEQLAKMVFQKGLDCPSKPYHLWGLGESDDWNLMSDMSTYESELAA